MDNTSDKIDNKCLAVLPKSTGKAVERIRLDIISYLCSIGRDCSLYLVRPPESNAENLQRIKVIHPSKWISFLKNFRYISDGIIDLLSFIDIYRIIKKHNIKILFSAKTPTNFACLITKIISNNSVRVIVSVHTDPKWIGKNSFNRLIVRIIARWFYKYCDLIIVPSYGVKDALVKLYSLDSKTVHVLPNPIKMNELETLKNQNFVIPNLDGKKYIVSVGRLEYPKDYPTLLDAYKITMARNDYKLVIVGDGSKRINILEIIHDNDLQNDVIMIGKVDNPHPIIFNATLLILSSRYEGFGNVLVEAMAHGVNIVSTNCSYGPKEILKNGQNGRLVPIGDSVALSRAIDLELTNPSMTSSELKMEAKRMYEFSNISKSYDKLIFY